MNNFRDNEMTLQEALDILLCDVEKENQFQVRQIFIEPPEINVLTDEDSADEDEAGAVDNLSGRQLLAPVEVMLENNERFGDFNKFRDPRSPATKISAETPMIDDFIAQNEKWVENRIKSTQQWMSEDFDDVVRDSPKPNYDHLSNMTPIELFDSFLTDDIINLLIEETKKYTVFKNCEDNNITANEIRCFIGILLLSGYNQVPSRWHYWEKDEDVHNVLVSNAMQRDRFFQIMKFIHCADNDNIDTNDKAWKLRHMMEKVETRCVEMFVPVQNINFDESMIKYFGRHSCKQFIRGRPIRFGYKMWCLNSADGYLINFDIYQGKLPGCKPSYETIFGKCTAPLIYFIEKLPTEKRNLSYRIFCDNLFTSANLLSFLKDRGYSGTGTIRENRQKQKGKYEHTSEKNDCFLYAGYSVVIEASCSIAVTPASNVSRYSQNEKKKISIPRPLIIGEYNEYMSGTDMMDQNISTYRIGIRGKKWWWPIFTWLIDMCVNNAWILQKKVKPNISQLQFRREIVKTLLIKYGTTPKIGRKPTTTKSSVSCRRISDDIRYDGFNHLVIPTSEKKRKRCAGEGCHSSIRTMCVKCNVGLCIECFRIFHTR